MLSNHSTAINLNDVLLTDVEKLYHISKYHIFSRHRERTEVN